MNLKKVFDSQKIEDASISEKKKNRKMAINAINGVGNNVKTFGIVTAENPNSHTSNVKFNKRANKSLLKDLKESGFVTIPVEGHLTH